MAVKAKTRLGKAQIATKKSGHFAPGPPAANLAPPPSPAGPVPAPFMYIAKTESVHATDGTISRETECKGALVLVKGCAMDVERPGNIPTKPVEGPGADVLTHVTIGQARMMNGSARTDVKGEKACRTLDPVALNVPMPKSTLHQSEGVLILGFAVGMSDAQRKRVIANAQKRAAIVTKTGDPVSVVSGEVLDDAIDLRLPGMIPVELARSYASFSHLEVTPLGRGGWTHNFHQRIEEREGGLRLIEDGFRMLDLPAIEPRASAFDRGARLVVSRGGGGGRAFEVTSLDTRLTRELSPLGGGGPAVLRAIRDAWGNRVELLYDGDERLVTIVDTAKRELRLTYDREDRIARVDVWAAGEIHAFVAYAYGDGGELASVTNALGHADRYAYDGAHRLTAKTIRSGPRFRYQYDDDGRCVMSSADDRRQRVLLQYDDEERTTTVHGNPQPVVYAWNERGAVVRAETLDRSVAVDYLYDDDLFLIGTKNAAGQVTAYERDARGNRVKAVNAAGQETSWEYTEDDLIAKRTAPGGLVTTCAYDARGALVTVTYPSGNTFIRTPDERGRLVAVDGPTGRVLTLKHDEQHNVIESVSARGGVTKSEYDALGRLRRRVDPIGRVIEQAYDAVGRPVAQRLADGTELTLEWDAGDRITRNVDAFGHAIAQEHTGAGLIAKRTMPDGQAWELSYDILDRLREIKNPRCETYELDYDRAGRVIEQRTWDGRSIAYRYSKAGEIARIDLPDDGWIAITRDPLGRVTRQSSIHGARSFTWSDGDLLLEATALEHDGATVVENEYGGDGRLLASKQGDHVIRYEYDKLGRRTARVLPGGQTTRYFWDDAHELTGVEHEGHKLLIQRDVLGRATRIHAPEGDVDILLRYDDNDRIAEQQVSSRPQGAADAVPIARRSFTYGPHARVRAAEDARWGATTYEHDAAGRLLAVTRGEHRERYTYDGAGYMRSMQTGAGASLRDEPWAVAPGNLLQRTEDAELQYDARSRRTKVLRKGGEEITYLWDAFDQLREVRLPDGARVLFRYDALGRRVRKDVVPRPPDPGALPPPPPRVRTVVYLWDEDEIAAEIDSERGLRVFVSDPRTFVPLLQQEGGQVLTCVTGHLGVPRELVDAEGRVAWAAVQTAWGDITSVWRDEAYRDAPLPPESPFRLLGQYHDAETGLASARFRYFDPKTARWLSPDPMDINGGANLFGWNGSPTERVDPLGLMNNTQFEAFLKKTDRARQEAHAAAIAEQDRIKQEIQGDASIPAERKPFVESARTSAAKVGYNEDGSPILPAPPPGRNSPGGGPPSHAERLLGPLEGTAVGAGRPHCSNCTQAIMDGGGVTASPIRSAGDDAWNPPPVTDPAARTAAQQQWNGPPVP